MSFTESPKTDRNHLSNRLELLIIPGRSLGPFRLGSSLWDTIQLLKDRPHYFSTVELKYSQEEPIKYDFIIALPLNGINLRFDGSSQRMKSIECFDPSKVKLTYQNSDVSSDRSIPTFLQIYRSFGPTYPGEFDWERSIYTLKYPGLAFTFPIPARHKNLYKSSTDLPLELPDGTTPIASRVYLYTGNSQWQKATVPSFPKVIAEHNASTSLRYGRMGRREAESIKAKLGKGISIFFPNYDKSNGSSRESQGAFSTTKVDILLHVSTTQEILADLGKPSRVFYKEEDKMKIHSNVAEDVITSKGIAGKASSNGGKNNGDNGNSNKATTHNTSSADDEEKESTAVQLTDYFLNYYHLGIDILIDGSKHTCKKIVLHANIPGHYDFQRYKRCPYQIHFGKKNEHIKKEKTNVLVDVDTDQPPELVAPNVITGDMKISTMQKRIPWKAKGAVNAEKLNGASAEQSKPVILTRGSSEQNPFGSTYLIGYDEGLVMEVMKNGHVPTIVLF
ncbi:hypothetical protein VTP01DRAFT_9772 [Rhizomucor pusillus]|uniref:uncharacterized protein n=1 Tax=Rhizomucor pusillus TaxID=4840 RepID=UPI00374232CB